MVNKRPAAASSASLPPKKKRNLACQRSASGGKHSPGKQALPSDSQPPNKEQSAELTLIFADEGDIHPQMQEHIIPDARPPLPRLETHALAQQLQADVVLRVGTYTADELKWDVRCYEPWTCSRPFEQIELSDFNRLSVRAELPCDGQHLARRNCNWARNLQLARRKYNWSWSGSTRARPRRIQLCSSTQG